VLTGSAVGTSADGFGSEKAENSPCRVNTPLKNDDTPSMALEKSEGGADEREPD
jgi:hypothetical protein